MADAEPHFFRIQRDTRFAREKVPYKTNVAADLGHRARGEGVAVARAPGVADELGLDGESTWGIGAWHRRPKCCRAIAQLVDDPRAGAQTAADWSMVCWRTDARSRLWRN